MRLGPIAVVWHTLHRFDHILKALGESNDSKGKTKTIEIEPANPNNYKPKTKFSRIKPLHEIGVNQNG